MLSVALFKDGETGALSLALGHVVGLGLTLGGPASEPPPQPCHPGYNGAGPEALWHCCSPQGQPSSPSVEAQEEHIVI